MGTKGQGCTSQSSIIHAFLCGSGLLLLVTSAPTLCYSQAVWESRTQQQQIPGLSFGDFDGDGTQETFVRTPEGDWLIREDGQDNKINYSNTAFSNLAFGDFNGDGKTDIFSSRGGKWSVSYGGTSRWQTVRESNIPLSRLAFGDFDGDGKTDIFRVSNGKWRVLYNGDSYWRVLNNSNVSFSRLAFGDFNGDGRTDVFKSGGGGKWWVSYGGTSRWKEFNKSGIPLKELRFADVDRDGKTDVLRFKSRRGWLVFHTDLLPRRWVPYGSITLEEKQKWVRNGDWDGDSKPDSFGRFIVD